MYIVQAYKTSKGIFFSLVEASKKANREIVYGSRMGESPEREDVQSVYLLSFEGKFAELNLVAPK